MCLSPLFCSHFQSLFKEQFINLTSRLLVQEQLFRFSIQHSLLWNNVYCRNPVSKPIVSVFSYSYLFDSDLISVQFILSVMSDSLWPHGLQHARLPCPSPTPRACSNSSPSSWWCHPTISSCLQPFPALGSFLRSHFFTSDGQSIGASTSASVLPVNIQDWFPLRLTGLTDLMRSLSDPHSDFINHWRMRSQRRSCPV